MLNVEIGLEKLKEEMGQKYQILGIPNPGKVQRHAML